MKKVSILLSLYKPNLEYLEMQLRSLNEQTYPKLELLVWNDDPEEQIDTSLFGKCINAFPVHFIDGKKHLGYICAFEELTRRANGDYISYCDQDDIWDKEKIRKCVDAIEKHKALAAVCDKAIIDSNGNVLDPSVRHSEKMACMNWNSGDDIASQAIFFCYGLGMTIVARREAAIHVIPFVPTISHDLQLVAFLAASGTIVNLDEPLAKYRRHGANETGLLKGVNKKEDYYRTRCVPAGDLIKRFEVLYPDYPGLKDIKLCHDARCRGSLPGIWRYRHLIPDLYKYEILLAMCPGWLFPVAIRVFEMLRGC